MRYLIMILLIPAALLQQGCRDKCSEGERGNPYIDMPMTVSPAKDTIRLGDTLTVNIEVPFDNINTRNSSKIDLTNSTMSEFGIDHALFIKTSDSSHVIEGLTQFKIIYERGGGRNYTTTSTQNRFERTNGKFIFKAKVIPLLRGLVNLVNFRAEGEMNKGCIAIDFVPHCSNADKHHQFLIDFYSYRGFPTSPPGQNHYYVWVK